MSNEMWSMAHRSALQALLFGPREFPLQMDSAEEQALKHIEALAEGGLVRRQDRGGDYGPTFEITDAGRAALNS